MTLRAGAVITGAAVVSEENEQLGRLRTKSIPVAGTQSGSADIIPGQLEF